MRERAQLFQLGDLTLQSGRVLYDAQLAFVTRGTLNTAGDNVVLFPTYYTGTHRENLALVGAGRALDPERYFIVIPNLLGNGESSSPSTHTAQRGVQFPHVSLLDHHGIEVIEIAFDGRLAAAEGHDDMVQAARRVGIEEESAPVTGVALRRAVQGRIERSARAVSVVISGREDDWLRSGSFGDHLRSADLSFEPRTGVLDDHSRIND